MHAATVVSFEILGVIGIREPFRHKPWTGVGNNDQDTSVGISFHVAADLFGSVILAAVDNRIRQSFLNRQDNLKLLIFRELHLL